MTDYTVRLSRFALVVAIAVFALVAPQMASPLLGQDFDLRVRAGTTVQVAELGSFLQGSMYIGETEKNLSLALRLDLMTAEGQRLSSWTSEPVDVVAGRGYRGRSWITDAGAVTGRMVAPLRPAEFVVFRIGQKTVVDGGARGVPRECRGSSHVLFVSLGGARELFSGPSGTGKTMAVCLDAGR